MYKLFAFLTVCLVSITIAACQPIEVDEAQAAYCADLKAYGQAVQNVRNLPDDATIDDFEEAMRAVDDAYRELDNSAWTLADAQNDALRPAYDELRASLDTIETDTPVVEARTIISDSLTTYMVTYNEVVDFSCGAAR